MCVWGGGGGGADSEAEEGLAWSLRVAEEMSAERGRTGGV